MNEIKKPDAYKSQGPSEKQLARQRRAVADSRAYAVARSSTLGEIPPESRAGQTASRVRSKLIESLKGRSSTES
ncbi:MAG: hypothetical protein XD95_0545 [Microgenomates bacterium 39_7]|nr:MAG: hypothetical protein XD95_0545 [Microgenomates bacterium 39_7]